MRVPAKFDRRRRCVVFTFYALSDRGLLCYRRFFFKFDSFIHVHARSPLHTIMLFLTYYPTQDIAQMPVPNDQPDTETQYRMIE